MFFTISKILSYLLSPLFWVMVIMLAAFFCKRWRKVNIGIALILIYLLSNQFIVMNVLRCWETHPAAHVKDTACFDVAIIAGGGIAVTDENGRIIFRHDADRLNQAVWLYHQQRVQHIVISGGAGHLIYRKHREASVIYDYLVQTGIPACDIFVDSLSDNTRENALNCMTLFAKEGLNFRNSHLLITSAIHMPRALACFKKVGLNVTPWPASRHENGIFYNFDFLFVPHVRSLQYWHWLVHEWVGFVVYWIMGYV